MQGGRGAEWSGIPGGKFSLGRLEAGSGYCVGAVVETRMGIREERDEVVHDGKRGRSAAPNRGGLGGNGMRDVWVVGEGFFRGVGGLFDVSLSLPLSLFLPLSRFLGFLFSLLRISPQLHTLY